MPATALVPVKLPVRRASVGLGLIAVFWPLNWLLPGPRTYWCYFPLWWGLALTIDALCVARRGASLLTRNRRRYVGMALLSIPAWWMFEGLNLYTRNWLFIGGNLFASFPLGLLGAAALSALMPVVFGSAELIAGTGRVRRLSRGRPYRLDAVAQVAVLGAGIGLLFAALVAWPQALYGLIWLALFLIIEVVNLRLGYTSLIGWIAEGDWRPALSVALGGLVAGIASEAWNFYSYPKWFYTVPILNFWPVFELPAVGYLIFFTVGWEMYAAYQLTTGLLSRRLAVVGRRPTARDHRLVDPGGELQHADGSIHEVVRTGVKSVEAIARANGLLRQHHDGNTREPPDQSAGAEGIFHRISFQMNEDDAVTIGCLLNELDGAEGLVHLLHDVVLGGPCPDLGRDLRREAQNQHVALVPGAQLGTAAPRLS